MFSRSGNIPEESGKLSGVRFLVHVELCEVWGSGCSSHTHDRPVILLCKNRRGVRPFGDLHFGPDVFFCGWARKLINPQDLAPREASCLAAFDRQLAAKPQDTRRNVL